MYSLVADISENLEEAAEQKDIFINYLKGCVPSLVSFAINVLFVFIIYLIGKKLIKMARKLLRRSLEKAAAEVGVIQFIDSLVKYALYVILFMVIIARFGIETSSVLALLGSAGLTIGFALQGSLSNFAGGVLILLLKPFLVGDYIVVGGGVNEGTVMEIQIFYTKLLTADHKQILIPNGTLSNGTIMNVSTQSKRRLDFAVSISYQSDLKLAKESLKSVLENYENVLKEDAIEVFVDSLDGNAVNLGGRIWVEAQNYWDAKCDIMENIKLTFDENRIKISSQQLNVRVTQR